MTSLIRIFLTILLLTTSVARADSEDFPIPAELQRDVQFWTNIFTIYSTSEGALHDNRNLAVVYERMDMPAGVSRRERNRRAQKRRQIYQSILRTLAAGKRSGLSEEEQRVLALWPSGVSNNELKAALGRIRYQQGLSDRFRQGLVRAGRWRNHVHEQFEKLGVPIELSALPHVESSYNPDARSHVGASGIWQFTRGTGRRFMQVDHVLDERNDPFLASEAAAKLLAYNYSITGNWPMAITAYNHGLSGARRAMRQFGDHAYAKIMREYRGRTFGFASRNFYVAFLAAKHVDQNAEKYFPGVKPEAPIEYQTYTLDKYVPVAAMAKALGIRERDLRSHNPALQATVFQGSKHLPKGFTIRVPQRAISGSIEELVGQLPATQLFNEQLPDLFHRVVRGDTLSEIADAYRTRVSTLVALNSLGSRHRIRIGQQIRLPAAGPAPKAKPEVTPPASVEVAAGKQPTVSSDDTEAIAAAIEDEPAESVAGEPAEVTEIGAIADDITSTVRGVIQSSLLSDPSDYDVAADLTIEVHPLETLGHYADWLGIRTQRLRDINGLSFRTPVEVGQRIKLDLSKIDVAVFEQLRSEYHREQQDEFFRAHTITGIREHKIRRGESVWILSLRKYGVPIWLFRQYNPELDLHSVRPGRIIKFPMLDGEA